MLRLLSIATVLMIALCIVVGASIALADGNAELVAPVQIDTQTIEAVEPDRRMIDQSLAAAEDIYEFDFVVEAGTGPHPEFIEPSDTQDI